MDRKEALSSFELSSAREKRAPKFPPICLYSAIWYAPKSIVFHLQRHPRLLELLCIPFLSGVQIPCDWASIAVAPHAALGCLRSTSDRAPAHLETLLSGVAKG